MGWGNNVHVPARTQALHPHHTRAAPPSWFTIGVGWGGAINGPPEKTRSAARQIKSRRAGEACFEGFGPPSSQNGPPERARNTGKQIKSRTAGGVRFEGFRPLSRQNGPPERAMSRAKQMGSRKAREVRFEGFGLLSGPNGAPERERSTEAHGERSTKTREQLGKPALTDFGGSVAKTGHQKEQGAQPSRPRVEEVGRSVLKDLGRKTGQNGPPERGRSTAKQIQSRRAGEVRIEGCAPPERERSTEAHRERQKPESSWEVRFEGFGPLSGQNGAWQEFKTGTGNFAPATREPAHTRPRCTCNRETQMRMHRRGRDPQKLRRCRQVSRQPRIKHAASDRRRRIPTASPVRTCHAFHTKASRVNANKRHASHRKAASMSPCATPATVSKAAMSRRQIGIHRKHHSQSTSHMPRIPRAIKHRQHHQAPHVPYTVTVDVTQRHACHGHDPRRHKKTRLDFRAAPATETQRRCHHAQHVPHKRTIDGTKRHACHAKTHPASQPRARVISEETRPRHIRGKFPHHNRGAFPLENGKPSPKSQNRRHPITCSLNLALPSSSI